LENYSEFSSLVAERDASRKMVLLRWSIGAVGAGSVPGGAVGARFSAYCAGDVTTVERCINAAESYGQRLRFFEGASSRGLPCHCADKAGNTKPVPLQICQVALLLLRQHRSVAGNGLGTTIKYLRRTTNAAAGNSLGTTIKYLRGAAGIGLGITIK
jgi:hypothetical protein